MAHRLRSKVMAAEAGEALPPASLAECRRNPHAPALPDPIERRRVRQRRSERHEGVVERAALVLRGKPALVRIVNLSAGGVTLDSGLTPDVGEIVAIAMEGEAPRTARVKWLKRGRIGLTFDPA